MDTTPNLALPYILAAQAQKHVTHNEAIRALDAIVQAGVLDRDLPAPPASPAEGDRYIVAGGASGVWTGRAGQIAAWQDGAWMFYEPRPGWLAWVIDEDLLIVWSGAAWQPVETAASVNPTPLVGVNTTADTTNRLAVSSPNTLLTHEGSGHQLKVNKATAANTASLLFQTGYSGRAEMGTTGDDDFHVKVSSDGSTWNDALSVDRSSGNTAVHRILRWAGDLMSSINRLWRFEPLAADTGDPKFTFGIQRGTWTNGPPGETNYRDYVAHMGWNWVGGTREDTSQAGFGLSFEHKYYQGGMFGGEFHLQGETSSGTQRRWIGTFLPRDSATGSNMSFSFDNISFYDESNNQRFKFTMSGGGKLELFGAAIWQTQNNVAPFRQLNAAGTSYLNLGFYNDKDDYVLPGGTWIVGGRNASGTYPGTALAVQATSANSGDSLLNMTGPTVTGEYFAIQMAAASSERFVLAHYNNNGSSSTAHAEIHIRVLSASSGDPRVSFDVNGAGAFTLGIDNSDSDKFKLSRAWRALGSNDVFSADSNKFEFHLPVKVPSYTVAGLPSASTVGAGALAYVTNASGGPTLACSNGTDWKVVAALGATVT